MSGKKSFTTSLDVLNAIIINGIHINFLFIDFTSFFKKNEKKEGEKERWGSTKLKEEKGREVEL